jgi:hypothetical protein
MNKSLEFCKERLPHSSYSDRRFDELVEFDPTEVFDSVLQGARNWIIGGKDNQSNDVKINFELNIDPDADFEYFTSVSSIHDGTMLFIYENMEQCARKVVMGQTYNINKRPPQNGDTVCYTVGDFVIGNEFDKDRSKFSTKEKPWMQERTTVMLPVKYSIKEQEDV